MFLMLIWIFNNFDIFLEEREKLLIEKLNAELRK